MTLDEIDKQFDEKFGEAPMDRLGNFNYVARDIKSFIHQIYTQTKAEQMDDIIKLIKSFKQESK